MEVFNYTMKTREEISKLVKTYLIKGHVWTKWYANLKRQDKQYEIGDMIYLKLQPYKLVARYYDPFKILNRVGEVAYRLE